MIDKAEINQRVRAEGLRFDQIEKDHVILWVLYALSQPGLKPEGWVFKGGTCLRHCFYEGYRFSEDLDFSCKPTSGAMHDARSYLARTTEWVGEKSRLGLSVKEAQTIEGDFQVEIPLEYSRGGPRRQGLPEIKVHLTFDEPLLTPSALCRVNPVYSDLSSFSLSTYSKEEILAEKMRALLQQQMKWARPRDLYDLWFILCNKAEEFDWKDLHRLFAEKCRVRKIDPDLDLLVSEELRTDNERVWSSQLEAVMASVPDFGMVWGEWVSFHSRAFGG
jgi:predicted nucleotidyltransferase component of viral defense system